MTRVQFFVAVGSAILIIACVVVTFVVVINTEMRTDEAIRANPPAAITVTWEYLTFTMMYFPTLEKIHYTLSVASREGLEGIENTVPLAECLNIIGREGWELVSTEENTRKTEYLFKRRRDVQDR